MHWAGILSRESEEGSGTDVPVEGVQALDHTADVGLEIAADELEGLFARAALGMMHLILEAPLPDPVEEHPVRAHGQGPDGLLRNWLREVLYLHEADGLAVSSVAFHHVAKDPDGDGGWTLQARVAGGLNPAPPAREIKGVTWHGLVVERRADGWFARVIFDV